MALEKDLNIPPYFADYNEDNNYHLVLNRPSVALQGRELIESQLILQNQIQRFGNHVFKDGSIVQGAGIIYYPNVHFISLEDNFNIYANVFVTEYDETYLVTNSTESSNAVRGVIKIAKSGIKTAAPETNRIYVDYITTGTDISNNDVNEFSPGDTLYFYNSTQNKLGTLDANNLVNSINTLSTNGSFTSNGYAYCIGCTDGIIYQKGYFVKVAKHVITVNDFSTNVSGYTVGFDTTETIITEDSDSNLVDNALGYPNENAVGAHRLQLTPTLISKLKTDVANNTNFFSIVEFDNTSSTPVEQKDGPEYNALLDQLGTRTYEESGDYVVKPFQIETRVNSSNTQTFYYEISSGIGYVRGKRIEKIGTTKIEVPRAFTTDVAQNQILSTNYGNYVICNEFLGMFDHEQIQQVSIYDAPQYSLSRYEGIESSLLGNLVGTAYVISTQYYSGTKGTSSAQYLLYLINVTMNSGKSFSTDAKSFYINGTFGKCKADIVLDSGLAVIKESNKNSLIFPIGISAVKRLTDNTGIGDTTYTYLQIKSGTMSNSSGSAVSITLDTAGAGVSEERLTSASGSTLTGNDLDDYLITLSANAYSANLTGTVAITTTSNVVVGTSTTFATDFDANSFVRIYANSTQTYLRRVTSVTNNTYMTIDLAIPQANTSSKFQKYFVSGTPLKVANVEITSNTAFTATLGYNLDTASQTVYCQYPVYRNQASAISKIIRKSRYVKIDCSNNAANSVGPWNLGLPDIHKIRNVYVGTTYANTNPERSTWFELDNGQRGDQYDTGRLVINPAYSSQINSSSKMLIELDYFAANTTPAVGFYSVESYPIDDANTANTNAIQTIEIPSYNSIELRNYIDFRPRKANTANSSTSIAGATINPANSSSYTIPSGGSYLAAPDTLFTADYEYYLPRIDDIVVDSLGNFDVKSGTPSVKPVSPFVESDQSIIAEAFVPAYPSPTKREFDTYDTTNQILINLKSIRRYTMKDIGELDKRIQKIEYYTLLSALEQQAKDLTIPDANGLDRFKNGIFADPFTSHRLGDVSNFEYKIAIDPDETVLRPFFTKHDIDTKYNSANSSNVVVAGSYVLLDYDPELYASQNLATKIRNCCESIWQWNGKISLYPSYDYHKDETVSGNMNINIDNASQWEQFATSQWGTNYGDWRAIGSQSSTEVTDDRATHIIDTVETTTTTTTTTAQRTVSQLNVGRTTQQYNLGSYVSDVSIQPYMASRLVAFVAYNMKPNTTLHAFFDDVNVDVYCAPGVLSGVTNTVQGQEDRIVNRTGNFGDALVSDSSGFICGIFRIPAQTFRTGDRVFQITNVDDIVTGADARITVGKASYTADSLSVTRGTATIAVTNPTFSSTSFIETTSTTSSSSTQRTLPDPIAQSFNISNIPDNNTGLFLDQIGLFFKGKDSNLGVTVFVCEMENNMPNQDIILGQAYLPSSNVTTSNTAATETLFTFDYPIFLMNNKSYAFIVQPDGNSPEYTIWVGETGGFDVTTGVQVYSNPYSGVLFVSSNRRTWTAIQKEDIKFKLYRSKFNTTSGYAYFNNDDDEFLSIDGFNKPNSAIAIEVGDLVYTVNSSANTANLANLVAHTLTSGSVGRIQFINEANGEIWLDSSNGGFSNTTNPTIAIYRPANTANVSVNTSNIIAYGNVVTVDDLEYHAIVPSYGILQPAKTTTSIEFKGTSTADVADTSYKTIINDYEYELTDKRRHVKSKSNESGGTKSYTSRILLTTDSNYVSPVINLSKKPTILVQNIINNDDTNEHTRYGNALTRYVSKKIVLADGQESEDLKLYLTGYRPSGTDIKVYAKFKNNQDSEDFNDKVWSELEYANSSDSIYSSSVNRKDYREYEFRVPSINTVAYAAYSNSGYDTYSPLSGGINITSGNNTITAKQHNFNASSDVSSANDTIAITTANSFFNAGDRIFYNVAAGNTAVTGLIANTLYYISWSNASHVALATTRTGANINITAGSSETGHYFTGTFFNEDYDVGDRIKIVSDTYFAIRTITSISSNTIMTVDNGLEQTNTGAIYYVFNSSPNDGVLEYYNTNNSRFVGFKEFAIKIVLLSDNAIYVPKVNDIRAISLQV